MSAIDLSRLKIDPVRGLVIWVKPPKYHPRLLGTEAGWPRPTSDGKKKYHVIKYDRRQIYRSHLIFFVVKRRWPKQIDHINGDSLDDRIANLREATIEQNNWNRKPRRSRPLPMGVRATKENRFVARISYRKRKIHIGVYDTPIEAHFAYLKKRRELFGEFA